MTARLLAIGVAIGIVLGLIACGGVSDGLKERTA